MSGLNGCKNQFVIFALLTKPCYVKKIHITATSQVTYNLSRILCTLRSKIKPLPKKINVHNHVDKSESIFSKGKYSKLTLKTAELFMYISNIHVIVHYWILNNELPVFFCKFVQVNFHVLLLHYICMHDRPTVQPPTFSETLPGSTGTSCMVDPVAMVYHRVHESHTFQ